MNQNFQAIFQESTESNSNSQNFFISGALVALNLLVMMFVGLYWMNPVMHEFISGKPLL